MPQGDDFVSSDPTPAAALVDDTPPAASAPEVEDSAVPAPAPDAPPAAVETPEQTQAKQDRAFAKLRRERDEERALSASLQRRLDAQQAPRPAPPAPTPLTPEQFVQQTAAAEAAKAVQQYVAAQDAQATLTAWESQEAALRATHADYDVVIADLEIPFPTEVLQALQGSPDGAALAYHLATHPEDAARLDGRLVRPADALRALGKLEARLSAAAAPSPPPPPVTSKPRPLTPVGPANTGTDTRDPDALPYEEYVAWYKRQHGTR